MYGHRAATVLLQSAETATPDVPLALKMELADVTLLLTEAGIG